MLNLLQAIRKILVTVQTLLNELERLLIALRLHRKSFDAGSDFSRIHAAASGNWGAVGRHDNIFSVSSSIFGKLLDVND